MTSDKSSDPMSPRKSIPTYKEKKGHYLISPSTLLSPWRCN